MTAPWQRSVRTDRLGSRDDVLPARNVVPVDVQGEANFVVYDLPSPPEGHVLDVHSWRPEQPPGRPDGVEPGDIAQTPWSIGNPCSLRTVWIDEERDRALRMKQFLYDWAPPAAGIAPIWDTPSLTSFTCQGTMAFVGADYRKQRGACVQFDRTQIELSVVRGTYEDSELMEVLDELRPAADAAAAAVRAAPFHSLNYWVRYRLPTYRVPYGLWKASARRPYEHEGGTTDPAAIAGRGLPLAADGFTLDSTFAAGDEVEVYWRRDGRPHEHLILTASRTGSDGCIRLPPEPESQGAELRARRDARGGGWIAGLTTRYGAWEYWWQENGWDLALFMSAARELRETVFLDVVEALSPD